MRVTWIREARGRVTAGGPEVGGGDGAGQGRPGVEEYCVLSQGGEEGLQGSPSFFTP